MACSEPNGIKEKAIFKSNFYYTATCLALGNVLLFVGTGAGSGDLQLPRAHEYRMAVTQKEPTPSVSQHGVTGWQSRPDFISNFTADQKFSSGLYFPFR